MKKRMLTNEAALTILASGYTYMQNQKTIALNDLALANVEALAQGESGRPDCEFGNDVCGEAVSYPGGSWGVDYLMSHRKKTGWI